MLSVSYPGNISSNPPSAGDHLSLSANSLKSSVPPTTTTSTAEIINSDVLSTHSFIMTFTVSYLGMVSSEAKSLSSRDLDKLVRMMKKRTVEKQKDDTSISNSPSVSRKDATSKLKVKMEVTGDIGPNISLVATDESPRKKRASSFNELKNESILSKKTKKYSFDDTTNQRSLVNRQQEESKLLNGQHSEVINSGSQLSVPAATDDVEDHDGLKSTAAATELAIELPKRKVMLKLTSESITLQHLDDNKIIRKKKVTEIASCTQVGCILKPFTV